MQPTAATDFALADQHGRTHEYRFPRERVAVLIFADRKGVGQVEDWVRPLYERYKKTIDIQGVAHLTGVPAFARGAVKKFLQALSAAPILLDWDGAVTSAYKCEKGKANVVIASPDGSVGLCIAGPVTKESFADVCKHIDTLLDSAAPNSARGS